MKWIVVLTLTIVLVGCNVTVEPPPCDRWSENDCWDEK